MGWATAYAYNQINGGRDGGSSIDDAMDLMKQQGACSLQANISPSNPVYHGTGGGLEGYHALSIVGYHIVVIYIFFSC